jgi:hypothetical protein
MKRATGLVLAVLALAVVAHADRIEYGGGEYAARIGADFRSQVPSPEALQSPELLLAPGGVVFRAGPTFRLSDDSELLTDDVFYSHSADSEKTAADPVEFDSLRRRLDAILGEHHDGRGEHLGVEHSDPFRRALGVQEVPEPQSLLLTGLGLLALAIWKSRSALHADDSERVR